MLKANDRPKAKSEAKSDAKTQARLGIDGTFTDVVLEYGHDLFSTEVLTTDNEDRLGQTVTGTPRHVTVTSHRSMLWDTTIFLHPTRYKQYKAI